MDKKYSVQALKNNEKFKKIVARLYASGDVAKYAKRYSDLYKTHTGRFGGAVSFFSSPGRIEVCGNHTDHNNGKVLAAAVTIDTLACVSKNNDNTVNILSYGFSEVHVNLSDLSQRDDEVNTNGLVKGILKKLKDYGYNIGGFDATTTSDVFKGAGVSSSAAFEVLVAEIVSALFNGGKITKTQKATASQFAENVYFKKPCGLMDQMAISLGSISGIDFKDDKNPKVKNIKWGFKDLAIFVVNCGGDHSDLTGDYGAIRTEMESVAEFFGKSKLRFVPPKKIYDEIFQIKRDISGRAALRALHYIEENQRVDAAVGAILAGDEEKFLKQINDSGESSYLLLQNYHTPADVDQSIPVAVAAAKRFGGVLAARVHGGGFAGTMLAFTAAERAEAFYKYMVKGYGEKNVYNLSIREDGAREVKF
ncbi:MAG: galactokinase [Clostridiales bacterium]|jgi:galactokinase|nr:galactokinase [Clostridiales bacterium]